ncbi:MAG TPA: hypothetical protein VK048_02485 [Atopostipes sp.]|nr:hypothetical protein [Atopostipes sp.]
MAVMIKRDTGIFGTMSDFQVIVNGEKVETIKNGDIIELELDQPKAVIQFSQLGIKTNELQVKDGESIELFTQSWTIYSVFALSLLLVWVRSFNIRSIMYAVIAVYLLAVLFKDGFIYQAKIVPNVSRY